MNQIKKKLLLFSGLILLAGFLAVKSYAARGGAIGPNETAARNGDWLWVYNSDNVAHEVGDVVVWKDGSLSDGLEISTTTTANNGLVAGVVVGNTIPATSWGWIQTHGYMSAVTVGTVAAGDTLTTGTTGEQAEALTVVLATGTAAGQAIIKGGFATALTSDSGGTCKAFLYR